MKLTDPNEIVNFEVGDRMRLPEDEAKLRAVLGDKFVDEALAHMAMPGRGGTVTITSIDRDAGTISVGVSQHKLSGRRLLREEVQSTWNAYEPTKLYPSRRERRANVVQARREERAMRKRLERGLLP